MRACAAVAVLLCATARQEDVSVSGGGDCTSHYAPVWDAPAWPRLRTRMLAYDEQGRVASLRTQARGQDVGSGAGAAEAVRVVDIIGPKGRRVVQVDVWRTDDGGWAAGVWNQCID